jgi:predicted O-methyltransferase YrrM
MRRGTGSLYRRAQSVRFALGRDRAAIVAFLRASYPVDLPLRARVRLISQFVRITNRVRTYHTQAEMLTVADRILRLAGRPGLTIVEAGAGKGGGTAKLSLVARLAGGRLLACDSFRGMPANAERHETIWGRRTEFREGAFRGTAALVRRTVARYGAPETCSLVKGWFADTLPALAGPFDVVLLDVDLVASTRTCVRWLYPRLRPGGVLLSQDGHLAGTIALLGDDRFWREEVGVDRPAIAGLGTRKLLEIVARGSDEQGVGDEPVDDRGGVVAGAACPRQPLEVAARHG